MVCSIFVSAKGFYCALYGDGVCLLAFTVLKLCQKQEIHTSLGVGIIGYILLGQDQSFDLEMPMWGWDSYGSHLGCNGLRKFKFVCFYFSDHVFKDHCIMLFIC